MFSIEQIKTLINGLKQPLGQTQKDAQEALNSSKQAQSQVSSKMNILNPIGEGSFSLNRAKDYVVGDQSFGAGREVIALGVASHAEGTNTKALEEGAHAEGSFTTAAGTASHAEGMTTAASGSGSHAEGRSTKALGSGSHTEGVLTTAAGESAHAEGSSTQAVGRSSHTEGCETLAKGAYSHAEGFKTIAPEYAHVQGTSNIEDPDGKYAHIVGNGERTTTPTRSNAHTLDWEGNAWFQGDVFVGSTSGTNKDDGSVRLAKVTEVIPAPAKAEVGQTVRVSAVDENGVPTAWEPYNADEVAKDYTDSQRIAYEEVQSFRGSTVMDKEPDISVFGNNMICRSPHTPTSTELTQNKMYFGLPGYEDRYYFDLEILLDTDVFCYGMWTLINTETAVQVVVVYKTGTHTVDAFGNVVEVHFPKTGIYVGVHENGLDGEPVYIGGEWTHLETIDPKFLPGAVLPVAELGEIAVSADGEVLTDEQAAKMNAVVGKPVIIHFTNADFEADCFAVSNYMNMGGAVVYKMDVGEFVVALVREENTWVATFM